MDHSSDPGDLNHRLNRKIQQLESLIEFGRVLAGAIDPDEIARKLALTIAGQLAIRSYAVLAVREGRPPFVRQKSMAVLEPGSDPSEMISAIGEWKSPFRLTPTAADSSLEARLSALGAEAVVPLVSGDTTVGFMALGRRASHVPLDDDDLEHAAGMAGQAVVAFEGAWQSQEATHWRLLTIAGEEWRTLDRVSRLVFAAVSRVALNETLRLDGALQTAVRETLDQCGANISETRVDSALERLVERGALAREESGVWRVEKQHWLSLPDLRRPLGELAREVNDRIGAYELLEKIGTGGMGEVFRGVNVGDGSLAAVKLLSRLDWNDVSARRRLEREGTIVASLSHPNIVRVLERGEHEGRLYIAMELLAGQPLSTFLKERTLTPAEAREALKELASALAVLHSRGVVHRDIKAANIMRLPSGHMVLLDFGLARGLESSSLTRESDMVGTVPYMSPEQIKSEIAGTPADIWSLGVVVCEMLTGRRPWRSSETVRLAIEIMNAGANVKEHLAQVGDDELVDLTARMLEVDVALRVQDGTELLRWLGVSQEAGSEPAVDAPTLVHERSVFESESDDQ